MANFVQRVMSWMSNLLKHMVQHAPDSASQQQDAEYLSYCVELERTVEALQVKLRSCNDPEEIAKQTLQTAYSFYQGDWSGVIELDLELDIWSLGWWSHQNPNVTRIEQIDEFENTGQMPSWVESLGQNRPIIIPDTSVILQRSVEEYNVYQRLRVKSIIAVPFGDGPVGFLAIRNPNRYIHRTGMMNILAYILLCAMAQRKTNARLKMTFSPDVIQNDQDVLINFFGALEICTVKGVWREHDFKSPKSIRVIAYILLKANAAHPSMKILEDLYPEKQQEMDLPNRCISGYIHRFRKSIDPISIHPIIQSTANGYRLNPQLHVMTDLQQFDLLWENLQTVIKPSRKINLLKQAIDLYKGSVFETGCDEHWVVALTTHYKMRYISMINELLELLAAVKEYDSIQKYASRAISLTPENVRAYYWLIYTIHQQGSVELAKNEVIRARQLMTSSEYQTLKKMLAEDQSIPEYLAVL